MSKITSKQEKKLIERFFNQARERNLSVPYGWEFKEKFLDVLDRKERPSLWLIQYNKYQKYSARESWWVTAKYLCGHEDKQDWAVRIPATIDNIKEALDWLTPSEVKKAQKDRPVERQGDMYFYPLMAKKNNFKAIEGTNHYLAQKLNGDWLIVHPQHGDVPLSQKHGWKAVQQKQMADNGLRVNAD
jgi:hypothetical protein